MYKNCTVGIVIPAYNEEGFVGEVIETLPRFVDRAYVVDDCSTDGTWEEVQEAITAIEARGNEEETPTIEAIRHTRNRGVGAAVTTGYQEVLADGMDVTAVLNGDGQMDPGILDRIIDPVVEGRAEYAKGNRLYSRDHVDGMTGWRRFGNAALTTLTKIASGYWKTMDSQNGYTAISHEALEKIDLDSLYEGYGFCNDVLVRLNARQMRVADVEMEAIYGEEQSTIQYHWFIPSVSLLLFKRFLWRLKTRYLIRDFHPLVGMYVIGTLLSTIGIAGIASRGFAKVRGASENGPSLEFSTELTLFGLISAFGAMTLDMRENEEYEEQFRQQGDQTTHENASVRRGEFQTSGQSAASGTEESPGQAVRIKKQDDQYANERSNGHATATPEDD